jgi:hypothetical protein
MSCGHQCPSICGEKCPEGYCQSCGDRSGARVDMMELKEYADIDLDETPIVALSCGHFFTMETLDGIADIGKVYKTDGKTGRYIGLLQPSEPISVPRCPDCNIPIRQFATKRYSRIVNQSVMDEISKRFHIQGLRELQVLEQQVKDFISGVPVVKRLRSFLLTRITTENEDAELLDMDLKTFCRKVEVEQQPTRRLFDAIRVARRRGNLGVEDELAALKLSQDTIPVPQLDKQILLNGRFARVRLWAHVLQSKFRQRTAGQQRPSQLRVQTHTFLRDCHGLVDELKAEKLPRVAVQCTLVYARMANNVGRGGDDEGEKAKAEACVDTARKLLAAAADMCAAAAFRGAAELQVEVGQMARLYEKERYEAVTEAEIAAIKSAMVSGPGGLATHSGHWYRCRNGHAVSVSLCYNL